MKTINFMSGETHINIENNNSGDIYCDWRSDSDTMKILLFSEIIKRKGIILGKLIIPYLPYCRQDRVINKDEPFSLEVFANLINSCRFQEVITNDVHSIVALELIKNLKSNLMIQQISQISKDENVDFLVCPDAGAIDRCSHVNRFLSLPIIYAKKIRESGKIISTECDLSNFDVINKNLMVSDDCIAGGKTFIELAKVIRKVKINKLILVVTHVDDETKINPELYELFDNVYHNDVRKPNLTLKEGN